MRFTNIVVALERVRRDRRGAVIVEFVLMTAAGLLIAAVFASFGSALVAYFAGVTRVLYSGNP